MRYSQNIRMPAIVLTSDMAARMNIYLVAREKEFELAAKLFRMTSSISDKKLLELIDMTIEANRMRHEAMKDWNYGNETAAFETFNISAKYFETASSALFRAATKSKYWDVDVYYSSPPKYKKFDEREEYRLLRDLARIEAHVYFAAWKYLNAAGVEIPEENEYWLRGIAGIALTTLENIWKKDQAGEVDIDIAKAEYLASAQYLNELANDLVEMTDEKGRKIPDYLFQAYIAERAEKMSRRQAMKPLREAFPAIEKRAEKGLISEKMPTPEDVMASRQMEGAQQMRLF